MKKRFLVIAATLSLVMGMSGMSFGALVDWTDWTAATVGNPSSASGAIGSISVTYTGEVYSTTQTSGGINYWAGFEATYTSATVDNAPSTSDLIALSGVNGTVNTITFSSPVTNPVMAIVSMGQPNFTVTYNFDNAFTILSQGPGYWGSGTLSGSGGTVLQGAEGDGTIEFLGTFTSISWTSPGNSEGYQGFNVGVPSSDHNVPLPGAAWLLGSGLVGLIGLRKFRKN